MNATIKKVFVIIGILVLALLIWQLFFNDNGIIVTSYNAVASSVNNKFKAVTGGDNALLPYWGTMNSGDVTSDAKQNGQSDTVTRGDSAD